MSDPLAALVNRTLDRMSTGQPLGYAFNDAFREVTAETKAAREHDPARAAAVEIAEAGSLDLLAAVSCAHAWMPGMNKQHDDYKLAIDSLAAIIRKHFPQEASHA